MICSECGSQQVMVTDTRPRDNGLTQRRKRICMTCGAGFSTVELPLQRVKKMEKKEKAFDKLLKLAASLADNQTEEAVK